MRLNTHSRSLTYKVQQLIVLPVLVCIAVIGTTLAYVFSQEAANLQHHRSSQASQWLAGFANHHLMGRDPRELATSFDTLLQINEVRGVYWLDAQHKLKLQRGQRLSVELRPFLSPQTSQWQQSGLSFFSSPITQPGNATPNGWLVVAVSSDHLTLIHYKGVIAVLTGLLVALGILLALAWRLTRSIERPLQNIETTLEEFSQGRYNTKTSPAKLHELARVAQVTDRLGVHLQNVNSEVQQQITQATSDLQETLDTIEIQSIELDIARKNAVEASRIKSQFLANTSHEIRTPINGILGFTNLLLKTPINAQQRDHLRTIALSSQGLLTIINDILDFSRLEENKLSLDRVPFQPRQMIEETLQILAPSAAEKGLQLIHISKGQPLPPLMGDPLRIKQVLTNLINNSIKFSDSGNIVVYTEVLSQTSTQVHIKISICDEGIGIDCEQTEQLFDAFTQADSSNSRQRGGTGLGLAISRKLIEKMDGSIALENRDANGTCAWFSISLPPQDSPLQIENTRLHCRRIAVHCPNPLIRQQLQQYFDEWQMPVEFVLDYADVLPTLGAASKLDQPIDVLLLMPEPELAINQLVRLAAVTQHRYGCQCVLAIDSDSQLAYQESIVEAPLHVIHLPFTHDHLYQLICTALSDDDNIGGAGTKTPSCRILVVDDNPANLQLVCTFLGDLGFYPLAASSGAQALQLFQQEAIDLIFMDVQMPEMDGMETTRRLRQLEPDERRIPIIALTAHDLSDQKYTLLEAGMDDFTSKPVSETQLAHLVRRWLHRQPTTRPPQSHAAGISQNDIMDLQEALRLTNNKPDLARDMLSKLSEGLQRDAEDITRLYRGQQWDQLQETVHRLYGGCCYCGVPELRNYSSQMDKKLLDGDTRDLDNDLNGLLKAIQRLREWVDEHDLDILFDVEQNA